MTIIIFCGKKFELLKHREHIVIPYIKYGRKCKMGYIFITCSKMVH